MVVCTAITEECRMDNLSVFRPDGVFHKPVDVAGVLTACGSTVATGKQSTADGP